MYRLAVLTLSLIAVACGSATAPDQPLKPAPRDPYGSIFVENTMASRAPWNAPAAGFRLYFVFTDTTGGGIAGEGSVGPGEVKCGSLNGFVGLRTMAVVGVADTTGGPVHSIAEYDDAARSRSTFSGEVFRSTPVFDPLVSADSTRGHTWQRPVKWRVTLSDTGIAVREDSLTICQF